MTSEHTGTLVEASVQVTTPERGADPLLDFPTMTFLPQLYALAHSVAAHLANVHPEVTHTVSRSRLDDASREVEGLRVSFEEEMRACHIAKLKPLKRHASFAETSPSRCVPCIPFFRREHVVYRVGFLGRPPRGQRGNACRYPMDLPRTRRRPRLAVRRPRSAL